MQLEAIQQLNVGDKVFEQFKKMLYEGEWKSGDKIPSENSLAVTLGVSRITVRESLHKLESLGLIESRRGEGRYVRGADASLYVQSLLPSVLLDKPGNKEMFEFRYILEMGSIPLAVKNADNNDITIMKNAIQRLNSNQGDKIATGCDVDFHVAIGCATKNAMVRKIYITFKDILFSFFEGIINDGNIDKTIGFHIRIVEAIEKREADIALQAMKEHLEDIELSLNRLD